MAGSRRPRRSLDAVHAPRSDIDRAEAAQQSPDQNLNQLRAPAPALEIAAPQAAIAGPSR